jgi:enoyl-CoA hydratase/carnithine racemase
LASGKLRLDYPAPALARLTITNPEKRGALDHPILDALASVLARLAGEDVRCVILTGSAGMFSAGYDISELPESRFADEAEQLVAHPFTAALEALDAYPYPTLAALGGHAIGGGLELALACDLRIAAAGIRVGMPPAKLGLVYSHTGLRRFLQAIGAARTRELFLLGHSIDAQTALAWGLVNRVAPAAELPSAALELGGELAAGAPLSLRGNKRVIGALLAAEGALEPQLEQELIDLRAASFRSRDMLEGVRAFSEKRPPVWRGE